MNNIFEFPTTVYGEFQEVNPVISKARLRVFYKYANRNRSYITDEFAEKLLKTIFYAPVKGIYDNDKGDYTDHGKKRDEGRIYGIVPGPNETQVTWEPHLDEDGIERVYACVDVYLFTGLYPKEAGEIVGKGHSMELFSPSIKFHNEIIDGEQYAVFDEGCFLGLQALGDDVTPCFEGSEFFSLQNNIANVIEQINKLYTYGGKTMVRYSFQLSHNEIYESLWSQLNPNYNEDSNWEWNFNILDVFETYAIVREMSTGDYKRVNYTIEGQGEEEKVVIGEIYPIYPMFLTKDEKTTIDTLRTLNGDTFDLVSSTLSNAADNEVKLTLKEEEISVNSLKIAELEEAKATLTSEREEFSTKLTASENAFAELKIGYEELSAYKAQIETSQKQSIINEYIDKLDSAIIESYKNSLDKYSVIDLDKDLAYELKKSNPSLFSEQSSGEGAIPKDSQLSGIEKILSRYANK